jgi:hypothetical protein
MKEREREREHVQSGGNITVSGIAAVERSGGIVTVLGR